MKKNWETFQDLVAAIEGVAAPAGAVVKSPEFVPDRVTGEPREIDVTIRHVIGTVPVLIAVECRYHKETQDVTWIEQLISKRDSVGADILIAVSASGFTKPAELLAKTKSIHLRTLAEIEPEDIASWVIPFIQVKSHLEIMAVGVRHPDMEIFTRIEDVVAPEFKSSAGRLSINTPFLRSNVAEGLWPLRMFSVMVKRSIRQPLRDIAPWDGSRILKRFLFPNENGALLVPTSAGDVAYEEFLIEVEIWADHRVVLPRFTEYTAPDTGVSVRQASYQLEVPDDEEASFEIQHIGPDTPVRKALHIRDKASGAVKILHIPDLPPPKDRE